MTNAISVLSRKPRAALAAAAAAAAAGGVLAHKWNAAVQNKRLDKGILRASAAYRTGTQSHDPEENPPLSVKVDAKFAAHLLQFVRICIPGPASTEFAVLSAVALLLAARSYLDLWASSNGGHVVKAIVGRDKKAFVKRAIVDIAVMMFPMSFVNNSLKYMIARLKVLMRRRLSMHFHDKYLSTNTFYKVSNLDSRIRNIDQLLTVDIEKFCSSVADLYSNVSKPSIDIVLFSRQLARSLGPSGPLCMILYFGLCSIVLRTVQPPFGQLAAEEQRLEGEYRLHHSRLIAHSEEIAFFGGGGREKQYINRAFDNIVAHLKKLFAARWRNGFVDAILVKYLATIVGYSIVSIPIFFNDSFILRLLPNLLGTPTSSVVKSKRNDPETSSASNIAGLYTRNSRLLLQLAGAIGRLVLAGKEVTKLTGYCHRVTRLQKVLNDLSHEQAVRKRFESSPDLERDLKLAELMTSGKLIVGKEDGGPEENVIRFSGVNLLSPDSTILVENLSFEIPRGCHVLTTGPNGSGKSSLFRVLAGLWPLYGGTLHRPSRSQIFYVPQRPYLALGTLRENVTYPMTWFEAVQLKGATDESIIELLESVHLGDIVQRKGGLDAVQDWAEVLSGGQKQRLGFSRLLFHRPDYAILDEASSAVSIDVEQSLYQRVKDSGITLISVSHRPSLWNFHDRVLAFDGKGGYAFKDIQPGDVPSLVTGVAAGDSCTTL